MRGFPFKKVERPGNPPEKHKFAFSKLFDAGALPAWLSPIQVRILTITDRADDFAVQVEDALRQEGLRVEKDLRNEKIGFKVREAQLEKIPFLFVIGDRESEERTVAVRKRNGEDVGTMELLEAVRLVKKADEEKVRE